MKFTKMHGLGNDYLYVYGDVPENIADISRKLSDRHFGAGSDGMIYIGRSETADYSMRIFNADGSEAKMCGNGIRCVGKYVYDKGYTDKQTLSVETLSGIKQLKLDVCRGKVKQVSVDMGKGIVVQKLTINTKGGPVTGFCVSVGNPHFVVFTEDAASVPLEDIGPEIEHHPSFPGGVNVEFVQVISKQQLKMRVWERGSGITMACGTGACASVTAAAAEGYCRKGEPVRVDLDGGSLEISIDDVSSITMTGPAATVYEGETELC